MVTNIGSHSCQGFSVQVGLSPARSRPSSRSGVGWQARGIVLLSVLEFLYSSQSGLGCWARRGDLYSLYLCSLDVLVCWDREDLVSLVLQPLFFQPLFY